MAKRAVLIGVTDIYSSSTLRPRASVGAIEQLLRELGGWTTAKVEGGSASRDAVLAALRKLASEVEDEDDVLLYLFGHGGVVQFEGSAALSSRPFFYIATSRPTPRTQLACVFDFELSAILAAIDRVCRNVSVILDCCHSASIVRSSIPRIRPPAWVEALVPAMTPVDDLLSEEGHPRIVRLAGASSLRSGFAMETPAGHLGYLTQGFVHVVREAQLQLDRLTWDTIAHRVREHAIAARGNELQWVSLAGPRQRLVFARETVELPRSVGFVASDAVRSGWLRAGLVQGVEVGDVYEIAALRLGPDRKPEPLARACVVEVGLNRAKVQITGGEVCAPANGSSATLAKARRKVAVAVDESTPLAETIHGSALLRPATAGETNVLARATGNPRGVELSRAQASDPLTVQVADNRAALELLEDWARADRLLQLVDHGPRSATVDAPLEISWGRYESGEHQHLAQPRSLASDGTAVVHVKDRVYFKLAHRKAQPESWYLSAIEIGVAGRPTLVTTSEPDGIEIGRGQSICIGCRGTVGRKGLGVGWPAGVSRERPRIVTMLFLASQRPIALGHLVRPPDRNAHLLEMTPRQPTARTRGSRARPSRSGPVLALGWGLTVLRYLLVPAPRDSPM